jgi:hypothetical protein
MQVAAPLAGPYAPLVYAAGAYKQSGRINPMALATMALPYVGVAQNTAGQAAGSFGLGNLRYGKFDPSILGKGGDIFTARDYLGLRNAEGLRGKAEDFLFGEKAENIQKEGPFTADQTMVTKDIADTPIIDPLNNINVTDTGSIVERMTIPGTGPGVATTKATQGILGVGGDFNLKTGKLLSSVDKKTGAIKLSPTKIATAITTGLTLSQTQAQIADEGEELGLGSSELAALQQEAAEMWEDFDTTQFRPKVTAAIGGLMRKNLAMGSLMDDTLKKTDEGEDIIITSPDKSKDMNFKKDFEPVILKMGDKFIVMRGDGEQEMFDSQEDAERYIQQIKPFKKGGRVKLREGSGDELPPDPTKPVNPFAPKPTGPVLPNKAEASPMSILNDMAIQLFGKPLDELDDRQKEMIMSFMKPKAQQGGLMRSNYALGSMPTNEESGLGGLPIEADMRYSGGFMPYGEKEKADDVPARLSKNEFVFTADAVRAAGGGSIQKGAQKMYNSMKQLESMGRSVA